MTTLATARAVTAALALVATATATATVAHAGTPTIHDDRVTFEAALGALVVDDYSDPTYTPEPMTDAAMSAVLGETDYESTALANFNQVSGEAYCSGCNGSFRLTFTSTSVTAASGAGVAGVGFQITLHAASPLSAFVTYGDGTTSSHVLPATGSFWGVTAPELIASIHVGLADGGATQSGTIQIDDLTIGGGPDLDGDGVSNDGDNCGFVPNPDQADADGDGLGDACDSADGLDVDGDGIANDGDNCAFAANADQADSDGDGLGNACDPSNGLDLDGDGDLNGSDNCPFVPNGNQADGDGDGVGDACDDADGGDLDGDGVPNADDGCPFDPDDDQADADGDGVGDACDAVDGRDADDDGVTNADDNCPFDGNPDQADGDDDGVGDACDAVDDAAPVADEDGGCTAGGTHGGALGALLVLAAFLGRGRRRPVRRRVAAGVR